jgi:hypothetical protein
MRLVPLLFTGILLITGCADEGDDVEPTTTNVYYENCDAVRAAGAAPIHSGEPGYGSHLDRDRDGVGCD